MTNNESTPSKEIIKQASATTETIDSLGRIIKLKKPGVLAQYRMVEMVGGNAATNPVYMAMIMPLMYVDAIDDDDTIVIGTKRELEALINRLGEEGISAVSDAVKEHWGEEVTPDELENTAAKIKKQQPTS